MRRIKPFPPLLLPAVGGLVGAKELKRAPQPGQRAGAGVDEV